MRARNLQNRLSIGTLIAGTTKADDRIEAMLDAAKGLHLSRMHRHVVSEVRTEWIKYTQSDKETRTDTDFEQGALDTLADILEQYVPDLCYLGTVEGDGADFGVWPSDQVPFHGRATDEVGKGDCLPSASVVPQDHWLKVNDHGNATLYRKRRCGRSWTWAECWSLV